jgi:hypothetical protein
MDGCAMNEQSYKKKKKGMKTNEINEAMTQGTGPTRFSVGLLGESILTQKK